MRTEELVRTQQELNDAKRLSDIGALAATVAHELRNPLAAIRIAAYNIKKKADDYELNKHFFNIEKKIDESNQIINNLLFYSRIKTPNFAKTDICEIVEECSEHVRKRFYKKNVKLKISCESDVQLIEADTLQMKELLLNLLNNSYDAVADNGRIEISTSIIGDTLKLVIRDNGSGIKTDDLKRLSEPFFTTKAKGTGLGLTVCHHIVSLHSGSIRFESEEGKGTSVFVELPVKRPYGA